MFMSFDEQLWIVDFPYLLNNNQLRNIANIYSCSCPFMDPGGLISTQKAQVSQTM